MNLLCKLLGHKPPIYGKKGWWSPGEEYGRLRFFQVDHAGRVHAEAWGRCARCEREVRMMRVHVQESKL